MVPRKNSAKNFAQPLCKTRPDMVLIKEALKPER
jgi:hypothetical protein